MDTNFDQYINDIIKHACDYIDEEGFEFEEDIDIRKEVRGFEK